MSNIRNANEATELIKKHFNSLFDSKFNVSDIFYDKKSFGNWIVILSSDDCILRFIQDRGQIQMDVGPAWASTEIFASEHFVNLTLLVDYIEDNQLVISPAREERYFDIDEQLRKSSVFLSSNYEKVILFLRREDFKQEEEKIKLFAEKKLRQMYPNIRIRN